MVRWSGGGARGQEGASAPSQLTKFFQTPSKIFLDTLVAHPKPTMRGIDITRGGKQQTMFHCFNLQIFFFFFWENTLYLPNVFTYWQFDAQCLILVDDPPDVYHLFYVGPSVPLVRLKRRKWGHVRCTWPLKEQSSKNTPIKTVSLAT